MPQVSSTAGRHSGGKLKPNRRRRVDDRYSPLGLPFIDGHQRSNDRCVLRCEFVMEREIPHEHQNTMRNWRHKTPSSERRFQDMHDKLHANQQQLEGPHPLTFSINGV